MSPGFLSVAVQAVHKKPTRHVMIKGIKFLNPPTDLERSLLVGGALAGAFACLINTPKGRCAMLAGLLSIR